MNVITSEFDPKRTAVSQAFVRAGGGGLLKVGLSFVILMYSEDYKGVLNLIC